MAPVHTLGEVPCVYRYHGRWVFVAHAKPLGDAYTTLADNERLGIVKG